MPRKQHCFHYLYKTTNLINNKYYYGMHSTSNLNDEYLGSGKILRRAIRKYGKENFKREILQMFDTRDELIQGEIELITENFLNDPMCMNLKHGGEGGLINKEHHLLMNIGSSLWNKKMWSIDEYKNKISNLSGERMKIYHKEGKIKYDTFTGKQHSKETKNKIKTTKNGTGLGDKNSQFGTCWITNNVENKKIKKQELDQYLNNGWSKGRKLK